MSHQRSLVHHFSPLNVQVPERSFLTKSSSISENQHKTALQNINFVQTKYLWVIKCQSYIIFPLLIYKSWRKKFLTKSCSISENQQKTASENINFAHTYYLWVIKCQLYINFFVLTYESWRKISKQKVRKHQFCPHQNLYESSKVNWTTIFFLLMYKTWRKTF